MSDTPVLAFDTSAAHCAVALLFGDHTASRVEAMGRGQAERLMPLVQEVLDSEGMALSSVGRIAVGTGPGNFTGIRISVSLARGLALGLGIPAIGVSSLEALRGFSAIDTAAITGPRETAYVQTGTAAPEIVPQASVPAGAEWLSDPSRLVVSIAQLAQHADADGVPPAPLYLKPADAAPARDAPPVILE